MCVKMALEDVPGVKHAAVDLEQCMAKPEHAALASGVLEKCSKEAVLLVEKKFSENNNY